METERKDEKPTASEEQAGELGAVRERDVLLNRGIDLFVTFCLLCHRYLSVRLMFQLEGNLSTHCGPNTSMKELDRSPLSLCRYTGETKLTCTQIHTHTHVHAHRYTHTHVHEQTHTNKRCYIKPFVLILKRLFKTGKTS